jgi:hypothetical protein
VILIRGGGEGVKEEEQTEGEEVGKLKELRKNDGKNRWRI